MINEYTKTYPVIITKYDNKHYVATSPNILGLVVKGSSYTETRDACVSEIKSMIEIPNFPRVQDTVDWDLDENQKMEFINITWQIETQQFANNRKTDVNKHTAVVELQE